MFDIDDAYLKTQALFFIIKCKYFDFAQRVITTNTSDQDKSIISSSDSVNRAAQIDDKDVLVFSDILGDLNAFLTLYPIIVTHLMQGRVVISLGNNFGDLENYRVD